MDMNICLIEEKDLHKLMEWKNMNKGAFFFKGVITFEMQKKWFDEYQRKANDFMFIIVVDTKDIGCIGARFLNGFWDIYNIILGEAEYRGMGLMKMAWQAIIEFILQLRVAPIAFMVVKENVIGVRWHKNNGSKIVSEGPDYYLMQYEASI